MARTGSAEPNPNRVEAGRRNRALRKGLTEEGRRRLREAALYHRPWEHATGPLTAAGRARSAANGKQRQRGPCSVRALRAELAGLRDLVRTMQESRGLALR